LGNGHGQAGYYIDRTRALFVAHDADPETYFRQRGLEQAVDKPWTPPDFSSKPKWTDATETEYWGEERIGVPGGITVNPFRNAVSNVCLGFVTDVKNYLEKSKEVDIFINGVQVNVVQWVDDEKDDEDSEGDDSESTDWRKEVVVTGRTVLHMAACEVSSAMVELLLERKADPNVQDADGRTPLSEAALWGRVENVRLLLKYGADKNLECVQNGRRVKAVDFARPTEENKEDRHRRSPDTARTATSEILTARPSRSCWKITGTGVMSKITGGWVGLDSSNRQGARTF